MDQDARRIVPEQPGTSIFTGGGWADCAPARAHTRDGARGDGTFILRDPCRILAAESSSEIPAFLNEIGAEQARGRYVAACLAYEAGAAFGLSVKAKDPLPLGWMAAYPEDSVCRLPEQEWSDLLDTVDLPGVADLVAAVRPELSVSHSEFIHAIDRIREFIAAGDTYQVNYTVRAGFRLDVGPLDYFLAMVLRQPVPYAAFLDLGGSQILSLAPEMFLRRRSSGVESMPMKGTRPRSDSPDEDTDLAYALLRSEKDRAENLMIVDMVRNDLGRVSRAGSIHVPALFAVEPYRTVWQMVSTVTGKVRKDATVRELMAATFPGASITGAPKHHTMEIISELETQPRGVYTGTVGLFLPGGDFTCNLAIRTLVHERGSFRLGVGAGIVWDSNPEEEFKETLTKATFALPLSGSQWEPEPARERARRVRISLFETLFLAAVGVAPPGPCGSLSRYRSLEEHLERLAASAEELGFRFDRDYAEQRLGDFAARTSQAAVVRLQLDVDGGMVLTSRQAPRPWSEPVSLLVSPLRTDPHDPLLRHKTTARQLYDRERERAQACGCEEVLFINNLGHITEGAISNIFARCNETWITPPVEDGLLPGIWRARFLRETQATEKTVTLEELLGAEEVVVGNSVRGAIRAGSLRVNHPVW